MIIYDDHISSLESQTLRIPYTFPTLDIINVKKDINDYELFSLKITDSLYKKDIGKFLETLSSHFI